MRLQFTDTQLSAVGKLPFVQREGEYEDALNAINLVELPEFNKRAALTELNEIKDLLGGDLEWRLFRGSCLGVSNRKVSAALVPYAIKQKLGRVYRVRITGLTDLMRIIHCWRYHGVNMVDIDAALVNYAVSDEIPFEVFKAAIDNLWRDSPDGERIIFQNGEGYPVSIYNTQVSLNSNVSASVAESISLSSYETMSCHVITSMIAVPRSVQLLGISDESCYVLDTTGRNGADISSIFSTLIFPRRYFARILKFIGEVTLMEDRLI